MRRPFFSGGWLNERMASGVEYAVFLVKIGTGLGREMDIAVLTRANDQKIQPVVGYAAFGTGLSEFRFSYRCFVGYNRNNDF
jgi:hypothetical protein